MSRVLFLYRSGRYRLVSRFPLGCRRSRKCLLVLLVSIIAIDLTCCVPGVVPRGSLSVALISWVLYREVSGYRL